MRLRLHCFVFPGWGGGVGGLLGESHKALRVLSNTDPPASSGEDERAGLRLEFTPERRDHGIPRPPDFCQCGLQPPIAPGYR